MPERKSCEEERRKPTARTVKGGESVYINYYFLSACILRKSGISGAGATASAFLFSFVSICRRSFGTEICVVTAFYCLSGILSNSLFLRKLVGIFGVIWPFVSIYHGFDAIRPSVGLFKACQRFGRAGRFRPSACVSRPCVWPCFFLIILYILLYRACLAWVRAYICVCVYKYANVV